MNLAPLAAALRPRLSPDTAIILLSHGLESVDTLHTIGSRRRPGSSASSDVSSSRSARSVRRSTTCFVSRRSRRKSSGGSALARSRRCRARFPRATPLTWTPDPTRLGFVGTLDHPPTGDGLERFLTAFETIAPADLRVRIVGGPDAAGRRLAARFRTAEYLGPLDDADLEREAATWSAFVHPLFCWARGCSTKLAVALAWQVPIATTPAGARGYTWRDGVLPMADTPDTFARLAVDLAQPAAARRAREQVAAVAGSSPTIADVGRTIAGAPWASRPRCR